jgi:hypothetical protein
MTIIDAQLHGRTTSGAEAPVPARGTGGLWVGLGGPSIAGYD